MGISTIFTSICLLITFSNAYPHSQYTDKSAVDYPSPPYFPASVSSMHSFVKRDSDKPKVNRRYSAPSPLVVPQPPPVAIRAPTLLSVEPPTPIAIIPAGKLNSDDQSAKIVSEFYDDNPDGSFSYGFAAENGVSQKVNGYMRDGKQVIEGSYSFVPKDGAPVEISYIADENGFQAVGDAIPKPHPSIVKAIEFIKSLPPSTSSSKPEDFQH